MEIFCDNNYTGTDMCDDVQFDGIFCDCTAAQFEFGGHTKCESDALATNGDSLPDPAVSKEQLDDELDEIVRINRQRANEENMLMRLMDFELTKDTKPASVKRCRDYDEREYDTRDKRFRFDNDTQ